MNQPDRFERFVVPEGTDKVNYVKDTKVNNAGTFTFQREDHTIGNLLRLKMLEDPVVTFAGYKIPHPLEYRMVLKVQTIGMDKQLSAAASTGGGGGKSPLDATQQALVELAMEYEDILHQFQAEVDRVKPGQGLAPGMSPYHPSM